MMFKILSVPREFREIQIATSLYQVRFDANLFEARKCAFPFAKPNDE